jgi:glycosyltransferase involved in cell wall biosynthesis
LKTTVNELTAHLLNKINNFEINIINDFSSDDTLKKLKIISKRNKKIKIYGQSNKGLGWGY